MGPVGQCPPAGKPVSISFYYPLITTLEQIDMLKILIIWTSGHRSVCFSKT